MIKDSKELTATLTTAHEKCLVDLNGALFKKSNTLYHYTDLNTGLSILENSSLRFTDIRYCNDPGEFEDGLRILNKMTDDIFDFYFKKSPHFIFIMSYIRHVLNLSTSFDQNDEKLLSDAQKNLAKYGIDAMKFPYNKSSIFMCCLSERKDDLGQPPFWSPGLECSFCG